MTAMTAIYVAATFDTRSHLSETLVPALIKAGYTVTSNWLSTSPDSPVLGEEELTIDASAGVAPALMCLDDINRADTVIVVTTTPSSTGGYHAELGYALAHPEKQIIIIGPRVNVFCAIPSITQYDTLEDFLRAYGLAA